MGRRFRALVVYKKDAYRQYLQEQPDPHLLRLLRRRHPDVLDTQRAHTVHEEAIEAVVHALRHLPVEWDLAYRTDLHVTKRYDLVVSVGGDGTFLQAAHSVSHTPIVGVNADPSRSEAVFCATTARSFPALMRRILAGRVPELRLYRLRVTLNGRTIPYRPINDILIAHDDPATMSRYRLRIGRREEWQKSSGLWVSTAAGSSSAIWAAGGVRLPWGVKRFQYRPRELYRGRLSDSQLMGGTLPATIRLRVTWLMRRGAACIDGPRLKVPLQFADELEVRLSLTDPLRVLGLPHELQEFKNKRPPARAEGRLL